MDLRPLLKPKSIAVIGASERDGFGGDACRNILNFMTNLSRVYFIHPKRDTVLGRKCLKSVADIDDTIDLAIVCTSKKIVCQNLREAHAKGCRNAVVFASGYRETGKPEDKEAELELTELCRELGINMMGPNCGGFVNYIDNVQAFAFVVGERERTGNVGLVSQSGQLCISLMESDNLTFSYLISAGNCAVVTMEDYIDFLVDDPDTKVVSIYLEGVQNVPKFIGSLRKAAVMRKPVVVLKTGRSEKGSQVAKSHTGSLAGSDQTYDALFKKFGVIRVNDMVELIAVSDMMARLETMPEGTGIASLNASGGETGICADVGSLYGLDFPDFEPETVAVLNGLMPSYATVGNPLDMTAMLSYDTEGLAKAIKTIMAEEQIHLVILGMTVPMEPADPSFEYMTRACEIVKQEYMLTKPLLIMPNTEGSRNRDFIRRLEACGIPTLPPVSYALRVVKYLTDFAAYRYQEHLLEIAVPEKKKEDAKPVGLSEHDSKELLKRFDIPVPEERIARNPLEAVDFADKIGYPLVMKIESPDILHKSDAGGVKLNIRNEKEVQEAYSEILDNASRYKPDARINGILMQPMLPKGIEMIIGITNDPQFGPMLLTGMGGVFVEIFKDVALYPAPVNTEEALAMLKSLKAYRLLSGYRGEAKRDIAALAEMIVNISRFATANKDSVKELDINPLFVYEEGKGAAIADALVVREEP